MANQFGRDLSWQTRCEIARVFALALDTLWPAEVRVQLGTETRDRLLESLQPKAGSRVGGVINTKLRLASRGRQGCRDALLAFWTAIGSEWEILGEEEDRTIGRITWCPVWENLAPEVQTYEVCASSCAVFLTSLVKAIDSKAGVQLTRVRPTENFCEYELTCLQETDS